jgi:serine/threonine protein kinase
MPDHVICADGRTYERYEIETWFARGMMTSPLTGAELPHTNLTQNIGLRNAIEEWQEIHAMHLRMADIEMEGRSFAEGSFKNVYRGSLRIAVWGGSSKRVTVAVLKMRRGNCAMESRMLLKIGRHPRVVRFLGQCVDGEDQLLITEFAPLGSLTDAFETLGDKFMIAHSMVIMQQIVQSMEHLASEGIIHRDLAAHNVLVFAFDENIVPTTSVKLSDYGMAVGCYNCTHVSCASGDKPIRICHRRLCKGTSSPVTAAGCIS